MSVYVGWLRLIDKTVVKLGEAWLVKIDEYRLIMMEFAAVWRSLMAREAWLVDCGNPRWRLIAESWWRVRDIGWRWLVKLGVAWWKFDDS